MSLGEFIYLEFSDWHLFYILCVIEWNKLDPNLRSAASLSVFKKNLLKFIRPSPNCF